MPISRRLVHWHPKAYWTDHLQQQHPLCPEPDGISKVLFWRNYIVNCDAILLTNDEKNDETVCCIELKRSYVQYMRVSSQTKNLIVNFVLEELYFIWIKHTF